MTEPRRSCRTVWRERTPGGDAWLTINQAATLMFLRRAMRWGRGYTTLDRIATATGIDRSLASRHLDRLSQLGLVGRRSRPGRMGGTTFWPGRHSTRHGGDCARHRLTSWCRGGNVASSTPYGGLNHARGAYVTTGGTVRAWTRGGAPPAGGERAAGRPPVGAGTGAGPRRYRRPPRLLYERCPSDGGMARLSARRYVVTAGRLAALWAGSCPRCGQVLVGLVAAAAGGGGLEPVGALLSSRRAESVIVASSDGSAGAGGPHLPPPADHRAALAAEVIAGGVPAEVANRLRVDYLGWREDRNEPVASVLVGPASERDELLAGAWSIVRDWRPVRYSQPHSGDSDVDTSVRESQPAADVISTGTGRLSDGGR